MSFDPLTVGLNVAGKVIDKLFPDPAERDKAKLEMAKLQLDGEFKGVELQMSAILAEAKSVDPWTSRARPSFLYVIYIMILAAIPMGILSVFSPDSATQITTGMEIWLESIPKELWITFGTGYAGYTVARSAWDKKTK